MKKIAYVFGWLTIDRKRLANFRKAIANKSIDDLKDIATSFRNEFAKNNCVWKLAYAKAAEKIVASR